MHDLTLYGCQVTGEKINASTYHTMFETYAEHGSKYSSLFETAYYSIRHILTYNETSEI